MSLGQYWLKVIYNLAFCTKYTTVKILTLVSEIYCLHVGSSALLSHDTPGKEQWELGVPNHPLCFPATVTFLGFSAVPRVLCHHKDTWSTDKYTRLKPALDPWLYLLPGPPVLRCNCAIGPKGDLSKNNSFTQKVHSCVSVAAQRAVSLFSLTEPQAGGPEMRPVVSPVQFHTPQTPRTTPTFSG